MRNTTKILYSIYVVILCVIMAICGLGNLSAFADSTVTYSEVVDDLKKDNTFKESNYLSNSKDFSIRVIQIAESDTGNLYIYTYQPSLQNKFMLANKINMSQSESVNDTKLYNLKMADSYGVFVKYKVENLTLRKTSIRYYNITSIYRTWVSGIDKQAGYENTINGVAFNVGQLWKVATIAGTVFYEMEATETIKVDLQTVAFIRHQDGMYFNDTRRIDSHFLAFSCERRIDKLLSADLEFKTKTYDLNDWTDTYDYGEEKPNKVTLKDYQIAKNDGSGWFGKKEEWHRISSTEDFVKEVTDLQGTEKDLLLKYDWILSFYESDYIMDVGYKDLLIPIVGWINGLVKMGRKHGTAVSDVALLRLEFDCNGEIFNLGVVSDIQTGGKDPINKGNATWLDRLKDMFGKYFSIALVIVLLAVLAPILPLLIQIIMAVVTLPFKFISALFKRRRG